MLARVLSVILVTLRDDFHAESLLPTACSPGTYASLPHPAFPSP